MGIDNVDAARRYLESRNYGPIFTNPEKSLVLFVDGLGDHSWERNVAEAHGWFRAENDVCCGEYVKRVPDALCCKSCEAGLNGNVTWAYRPQLKLNAEIERRVNAAVKRNE